LQETQTEKHQQPNDTPTLVDAPHTETTRLDGVEETTAKTSGIPAEFLWILLILCLYFCSLGFYHVFIN